MSLSSHCETDWSTIRGKLCGISNFDRLCHRSIIKIYGLCTHKICKKCLQTAAASGIFRPSTWASALDHSDISAMCCEVISNINFCDICCFSSATLHCLILIKLMTDERQNRPILSFVCHRLKTGLSNLSAMAGRIDFILGVEG